MIDTTGLKRWGGLAGAPAGAAVVIAGIPYDGSAVYRKGAELVRMLATVAGEAAFARGFAQFIARHDGRAVTCEDFVTSIADAAGRDLSQFMRWYAQAGTPRVAVSPLYDDQARSLELTFVQSCPPTPGQAEKEPFLIPLAIGLLGPDGAQLRVKHEPGAAATAR